MSTDWDLVTEFALEKIAMRNPISRIREIAGRSVRKPPRPSNLDAPVGATMGRIHGKLRGGGVPPGGYQTPRQEVVDDFFRIRAGGATNPNETMAELFKTEGGIAAARALRKLPERVQRRVIVNMPRRVQARLARAF